MNDATGNFGSGIAGWLGGEIIRIAVNDDCSSDDLAGTEFISQKCRKCIAIISKQWRKIPGVRRMFTVIRIIMGHCIGKWVRHISAAVISFVDMVGKDGF